MEQYTTKTEKETIELGRAFAAGLYGGDVVLLYGDLGAGKTVFVKGVAAGLGARDTITSPTFTLMNLYALPASTHGNSTGGQKLLCHIDTYRLKSADELRAIGAQDYIGHPNIITIIEWPEKAGELISEIFCFEVTLEGGADTTRTITVARPDKPHSQYSL